MSVISLAILFPLLALPMPLQHAALTLGFFR